MGMLRYILPIVLISLLTISQISLTYAQEIDWRQRAQRGIESTEIMRSRVEGTILELEANLTQDELSPSRKDLKESSDYLNRARRYLNDGLYNRSITESSLATLEVTRAEYRAYLSLVNRSLISANSTIQSVPFYLGIPQYARDILVNATEGYQKLFYSGCLNNNPRFAGNELPPVEMEWLNFCVDTMRQATTPLTFGPSSILALALLAEDRANEYEATNLNIFYRSVYTWWIPTTVLVFLLGLLIGVSNSALFKTVPPKIMTLTRRVDQYLRRRSHPEETSESPNSRLVSELIDTLTNVNSLCQKDFGVSMFKADAKLLDNLRKPCNDEDAFLRVITSIGTLIDDVVPEFSEKFKSDTNPGSINLLSSFIKNELKSSEDRVTPLLRNLKGLRNKKSPIHKGDKDIIAVFYKWHLNFPPDWSLAGRKALEQYFEALALLKTALTSISARKS